MKKNILILWLLAALSLSAQQYPPYIFVDGSGNPYPSGSGPAIPTQPPFAECYTNVTGQTLPCNFSAGATSTSVLVTDPPFNAKCDGATDDSAAIQAALNSGASIINLPQTIAPIPYDPFQCNFSMPLVMRGGTELHGNLSILNYTGAGGVALTAPTQDILTDFSIGVDDAVGPVTALLTGPDIFSYDVLIYSNAITSPLGFVALSAGPNMSYSTFIALDAQGPVTIKSANNPNQTITFIGSNIGGFSTNAYPSMVTIDGSPSPNRTVVNFISTHIDMTGSPAISGACAVCVTATSTNLVNFDGSYIITPSGYTGVGIKFGTTGSTMSGNLDSSQFADGTLFGGSAWTGLLSFGATTYRGSAALLTYRCNGGTQAGLLYANNTSCVGGTAVATGDSAQ